MQDLSFYDYKCIRVTSKWGDVFEGIAELFPSGYGLHEFGRDEESLKIRDTYIFANDIGSIEYPITNPDGDRIVYGDEEAETVLIQMVDDHDLETLGSEIKHLNGMIGAREYLLYAVKVKDWNRDLSPWEAPAVFGKEDFGGRAKETLLHLQKEVFPALPGDTLKKRLVIGGYSLSGLFALFAACESNLFSGVAAASPSVWFPGFAEYVKNHPLHAEAVYLSLGDMEEKTKNAVMSTVGDAIRNIAAGLQERAGIQSTLEWNKGGHFKEADLRTAKAFAWVLNRL